MDMVVFTKELSLIISRAAWKIQLQLSETTTFVAPKNNKSQKK